MAGPHPYPVMVRDFQSVIGREARRQILKKEGRLPDCLIACVGGGSNAMGIFYPFRNDAVTLTGVEAAGKGIATGLHCGHHHGRPGRRPPREQDLSPPGRTRPDPGRLRDRRRPRLPRRGARARLLHEDGARRLRLRHGRGGGGGLLALSRREGIIPALESAHAVAYAMKTAPTLAEDRIIIINLSGRGDKDAEIIEETKI